MDLPMFGKWKAKSGADSQSSQTEESPSSADSGSGESPRIDASLMENWTSESLDGRNVEVFTPPGSSEYAGCVLFLHGHGQVTLRDNEVFTEQLARHNLACVAPDGKRSWWLDRICEEFSTEVTPQSWLIETVVPFIEQRVNVAPPHICLLGVSMGGQGALQLSFRDAARFPIVAAISPAIDFHQLYGHDLPLDGMFENLEDARQGTVVLNLHPLAWPRHQWFCCDPQDGDWFDGCARLGMKLSSSGILHERDLDTSAGGHSWDYFNHMAPAAFKHMATALTHY